MLKTILITFFLSMVPILELRGAIPIGTAGGLNPAIATLIASVGNLVPIPFILLFIPKILAWMREQKYTKKLAVWLDKKVHKNRKTIEKYGYLGLIILVAIPLPGTGAWTGALVASCLEMHRKRSMVSIAIGVTIAALIVFLLTFVVKSAVDVQH